MPLLLVHRRHERVEALPAVRQSSHLRGQSVGCHVGMSAPLRCHQRHQARKRPSHALLDADLENLALDLLRVQPLSQGASQRLPRFPCSQSRVQRRSTMRGQAKVPWVDRCRALVKACQLPAAQAYPIRAASCFQSRRTTLFPGRMDAWTLAWRDKSADCRKERNEH